MLELVLVLNTIWFVMGFNVFSIRSRIFAKLVVPREHRDTPVFETLIMAGKFLGGFNLAFAVLSFLLFLNIDLFDRPEQWAIILAATAIAHGTQFAFNVPVALQNRQGKGVWQVKGVMRFIFVTDLLMTLLNAVLAIMFLN
jgi:hypothetical protein